MSLPVKCKIEQTSIMPLIYNSTETSVLGTETHPSLTQGKSWVTALVSSHLRLVTAKFY